MQYRCRRLLSTPANACLTNESRAATQGLSALHRQSRGSKHWPRGSTETQLLPSVGGEAAACRAGFSSPQVLGRWCCCCSVVALPWWPVGQRPGEVLPDLLLQPRSPSGFLLCGIQTGQQHQLPLTGETQPRPTCGFSFLLGPLRRAFKSLPKATGGFF